MIIGIAGCKGVGKDTVGNYLRENHGFVQTAFALKMKEAVAALFGVPPRDIDFFKESGSVKVYYSFPVYHPEYGAEVDDTEGTMKGREFLQRFGTEMGRKVFGENFWVDQCLPIDQLKDVNIVVTDTRFREEADRIQYLGGYVIEIQRPGYVPDGHESEEPLPRDLVDYEILNDGTLADLYQDVEEVLADIKGELWIQTGQ